MQQYLYKATGIALGITYSTFLIMTNALLRLLLGLATDMATRQTIAWGLGLLVVTTPLWWLLWRWLHWQLTTATPAMRHAFRTYTLIIVVTALLLVFASAGAGVAVLARLALGLLADSTLGWAQGLLAVTAMVVATAIWYLHWPYVVDQQVIDHQKVAYATR
jgi:hypothetical protein